MREFVIESEALPMPAHDYFVEKDTAPFRALLAKVGACLQVTYTTAAAGCSPHAVLCD